MLEEDEPLLRQKAKDCKNAEEKIRYYALHAVSGGRSITEAAELFLVERQTIHEWINRWNEEKDLSNKPKLGKPPAFTEDEKKELKSLIDEGNPQKHGINAGIWDCTELRKYYLSKGKIVSEETIRLTLREMGAHYIKAQHEYREADYEKQREFALQFLKDMGKLTDDIALLFEDEMSACTVPHKGYGWTFNERLITRTIERNKERVNCFGVTNPITGERIQMSSIIAKAPALVRFLEKVDARYRNMKEIWIYLDNGPVHKSKLVKKYMEEHPRIKLKFISPYSPDINPQEQIWNYDRKKFLNNNQFVNAKQLSMRLSWFVRRLKPDVVKSVASLIPIEALLSFQV
jgi:transposase